MDTLTFDKLLLQTAFSCMASDGNIDKSEISTIKSLCENTILFKDIDIEKEINAYVVKLNDTGKDFILQYFNSLKNSLLTEEQELLIIDFAVKIIFADEILEYSEIKFFKIIRDSLLISNEKILNIYPDIEQLLEKDIITESYHAKIINQYFNTIELPKFDPISFT
jgi:uncharacterized tellurite resistance protein B-like protein